MHVETYEVPESLDGGVVESDAAAVALIESLDLKGQRELLNPERPTERMPYRHMTEQEDFTYRQLLPVRVSVETYNAGPIPLRVLQIVGHCRDASYFHELEVWYPRSARIDDPILVGVRKEGQYGARVLYMLARWGNVLRPISELVTEAGATWRDSMVAACRKAINEAQSDLRTLESLSPEEAANIKKAAYTSEPSFSSVLS